MKLDNMISIAVEAAEDKKALNITILDISDVTTIGDYFVICTGNSERQVMAIADNIEEKMHESGYSLRNKEGYRTGRWILMDFGDVIVHVFHKEDREFYNLDRVWKDAKKIEHE
nr:ribosome silencing factor [Clostridiisalibacter paucivorans]